MEWLSRCIYPATPNTLATHAICLTAAPLSTPCTCPFRIMFMISYPCSVRHAVSKEKQPIPGYLASDGLRHWSMTSANMTIFAC